MNALAPLFDEFADRAVRRGRLEQLDLGLTHLEESGLYFLRGNFFDVVAFGAEHFLPERDGGIQTLDCDAEVFDV